MFRVPRPPVRAWFFLALVAAIVPLTLPRSVYAKAPTPPALLAMPTTTTYQLRGTFTTTNQNMLGPGAPVVSNITQNLFGITWNNSGSVGDIESFSIDPCGWTGLGSCEIGGDFGAELTASTTGDIGMSIIYHDVTSGSVSVTYPITITLTITTNYPANGPKTLTIESSLSVDPGGAKVEVVAPTYSRVSLNGRFGASANFGAEICVFDCATFNTSDFGGFTIPTASGEIFSIDASTFVDIPGLGWTDCFNAVTNFALGAGPYYGGDGRCGTNGYIGYAEPKFTTVANPNDSITATSVDPYVVLPISAVAWAARIAGLPPIPLNFGPTNVGGFTFGYTTFNLITRTVLRQHITYNFNPIIDLGLQLPQSMSYVVTDPDNGNAVVTNTAGSTVNFRAGHKVVITIPQSQPLPFNITPTLSVRSTGNNFSIDKSERLTFDADLRAVELYIKHGGIAGLDPLDFRLGPLFQQNTPAVTTTLSSFTNSWNLQGFNSIPLPAFQPPMLLLSDRGIRGQTEVHAIAPSTVTGIECVDSRGNLRVVGTDLDAASVRTLIYAGAGWHVITCTATTVSDGTFVGTFGLYVLSDPYRAANAPPPALDFGTPPDACNPRGFLLKNDTLKNFNLNSLNMAGANAADFFIVTGGDTSQMGPLQPGYGQVFALQYCKTGDGPRTANLILNGSLGTGAGAPAPVSIPLVGNGPNLTITKTQNRPTPVTNQQITYTVIARANGQAANNVKVRDTLPAGLGSITASANGGFACTTVASVVECTGNLAANASVTITITATVTAAAGTTLLNTAVVDPDNIHSETNENDNTATATATVTNAPNLTITKQQSTSAPLTDGSLAYTLTATSNNGASSGVKVRDVLPAGVAFESVSATGAFGCQFIPVPAPTVECTGNLATNASTVITITVKVTSVVGTVLNNSAVVDPDNAVTESNEGDNTSATVSATVANGFNLSITKTQSATNPNWGTNLVYTVKAKAVGGGANGVVVRDTLPAGVSFVSVTNDSGFACPPPAVATPNILNCTGNLASGQEATFTITVLVTAFSGSLLNTATVDPADLFVETSSADNSASVTATAANPRNLTITKTRTSAATTSQTGTVTWSIVVQSVGAPTPDVRVEDNLPANLNFVSVSNTAVGAGSTFGCFAPSGGAPKLVKCGGSLAANESVTITLTTQVTGAPADNTVITNTATVDLAGVAPEFNESDNSASATVTVDIP